MSHPVVLPFVVNVSVSSGMPYLSRVGQTANQKDPADLSGRNKTIPMAHRGKTSSGLADGILANTILALILAAPDRRVRAGYEEAGRHLRRALACRAGSNAGPLFPGHSAACSRLGSVGGVVKALTRQEKG